MKIYLLGDIGAYKTADAMADKLPLRDVAEGDLGILLGDNVYPLGVPPEGEAGRARGLERAGVIFPYLHKKFGEGLLVLPGNHDYNRGLAGGGAYWAAQKETIASVTGDPNLTIKPDTHVTVHRLADDVVLLSMDTQRYLQPDAKGKRLAVAALKAELEKILALEVGNKVLVCGHHPLFSRGLHGGRLSLRQHIFPLTLLSKRLYVPLPGIGTMVAAGRRLLGTKEDIRHKRYRRLKRALLRAFAPYKNLVYAAGHDHNLQHIVYKGNQHLVSGAASKATYVRPGGKADFVASTLGYFYVEVTNAQASVVCSDGLGAKLGHWPMIAMQRQELVTE